MSPETHVKINASDFEFLKKSIRLISSTQRERKKDIYYASHLPEEIGIQLTNRCNLRCRHCFQYNGTGNFHSMEKKDLSIDILNKILNQTCENRSRLYLWGGEPLLHRQWPKVSDLINTADRWTVICTNGLMLKKRMADFFGLGRKLTLLVSLDGFENDHDALRGKGVFDRVYHNIRVLLKQKEKNQFKGKLSLICVVSEHNAGHLYRFARFCESLGIDALYLNLPWYISKTTQDRMDHVFEDEFNWLPPPPSPYSWHSHNYRISSRYLDRLKDQVEKIMAGNWDIRINLQPPVGTDQLHAFCTDRVEKTMSQCIAVSNRMEVDPFGECGACKFFPEFRMGNLASADITDIWHSKSFKDFRQAVNRKLMPVCTNCSLLYLNRSGLDQEKG